MDKIIDFLEKHMSKAVLVTVVSAILQVFFHVNIPGTQHIPNEVVNQLMTSSSGLQSVMLLILYLFLQQKKKD